MSPMNLEFSKKLNPVGGFWKKRVFMCGVLAHLCTDGKVHVFYSRWPEKYGMGGWIHKCEIAHAVAESAESDSKFVEPVLASPITDEKW